VSSLGISEVAVYCEHCGIKIFPERPVCTRCGRAPSRHFLQLFSLAVLLLAVIGNSVVGLYLLPKLTVTRPSVFFFRAWLWTDREGSLYGWMPLAAALLLWEFLVWRKLRSLRKTQPVTKVKGWVSRKILTFVLAAGFAPILPWWLPANQPSDRTLAALARYPGLPGAISWGGVLLVAIVLCLKTDTRERLLGQGKTLALMSLSTLALFLLLTLFAWHLT
jgi:hypothetical protein